MEDIKNETVKSVERFLNQFGFDFKFVEVSQECYWDKDSFIEGDPVVHVAESGKEPEKETNGNVIDLLTRGKSRSRSSDKDK